jgi:hypothetical protein
VPELGEDLRARRRIDQDRAHTGQSIPAGQDRRGRDHTGPCGDDLTAERFSAAGHAFLNDATRSLFALPRRDAGRLQQLEPPAAQALADAVAIAHHAANDEQRRGAADADRLPHDMVGLQQMDHARGKDDGRAVIGQGPRAIAVGNDQRRRVVRHLGTEHLQHRGRGIEPDIADRQTREVDADLAGAGSQLHHQIPGIGTGLSGDRLRHSGANRCGESGARVVQ